MFDFIFIDTPPVGLFPDALLVSHHAEEALFVCKHNDINRHKIKFALTKLDRSATQVLGTVMNQMSASRRHQYGYGYRDYGYQYYGQKDYAKYYHDDDEENTSLTN
jgi:Mrp family chromosome partitioning ATPase